MADRPVDFGIVGGGWRSAFYLRVAAALPERFGVAGVVLRDPAKGAAMGVPVFGSMDELLARSRPAFVVLSVAKPAAPALLADLAGRKLPVLLETPAGPDMEGLLAGWELVRRGARIQIAEQYLFQPLHAARLAVVGSGRLGDISQAQVAVAHDYHGMSLLRHFLGAGFEPPRITARHFVSSLMVGPNRQGPPPAEAVAPSRQTLAWLEFGSKLGVYDFVDEQYFSWIRGQRLLIRGSRGELDGTRLRYLRDFATPVETELRRVDSGHGGNLEGYCQQGIMLDGEWIYRNPYAPARFSDEEIAVATCLERMAAYAAGGPEFYSFAEGAQDQYLALLIHRAAESGEPLQAVRQPWAA